MTETITLFVPNVERYVLLSQDETPMPDDIEPRDYSAVVSPPVRWELVGPLVSRYGHALAAGTLGRIDNDGKCVFDLDVTGLTGPERKVVSEWFGRAVPPTTSAEHNGIEDGRHRLQYCWAEDSTLLLPIRSELFLFVDEEPYQGPEFVSAVQESAEALLKTLPASAKSRNSRFLQQVHAYLNGTWDTSRGHWISQP